MIGKRRNAIDKGVCNGPKKMARRRAAVDRFAEEYRRTQEWIKFGDIADWFARRDNAVVPNETARSGAYNLLRNDLLAGDFEEDGKSQVRFLHPDHETEWISRRRMVDRERETAVSLPDAMDTIAPKDVIAQYLAHCWIPYRIFHRWLTKHGLSVPSRFDLEEGFAAHSGAAKPNRLSIQTSRSNARRRGRKPEKIERTKEAMRRDISERKLTIDDLKAMLEKQLVEKYGVSRTTARDARNAVLSEIVENPNPANDI
jgi:hypothetical protein